MDGNLPVTELGGSAPSHHGGVASHFAEFSDADNTRSDPSPSSWENDGATSPPGSDLLVDRGAAREKEATTTPVSSLLHGGQGQQGTLTEEAALGGPVGMGPGLGRKEEGGTVQECHERAMSNTTRKRRGRYNTAACDGCRLAKRRCDGARPCGMCVEKDVECTHLGSQARLDQRAAKAARSGKGSLVSASSEAVGARLMTMTYLLRHYARTFLKRMNVYTVLVDGATIPRHLAALEAGDAGKADDSFVVAAMATVMMHCLGHIPALKRSLERVKTMVGGMAEHATPNSVAGFVILAVYYELTGQPVVSRIHGGTALALGQAMEGTTVNVKADTLSKIDYADLELGPLEAALAAINVTRDSRLYSFRLRSFAVLVDMQAWLGSDLVFYFEKSGADHARSAAKGLVHSGIALVAGQDGSAMMVDVWGTYHAVLTEEQFTHLESELERSYWEHFGRVVAELGDSIPVTAEGGETDGMVRVLYSLFRIIVMWRGGRPAAARDGMHRVVPFLSRIGFQFAPGCFLTLITSLLVEFCYWNGDLEHILALRALVATVTRTHARATSVLKEIDKMTDRLRRALSSSAKSESTSPSWMDLPTDSNREVMAAPPRFAQSRNFTREMAGDDSEGYEFPDIFDEFSLGALEAAEEAEGGGASAGLSFLV